MHCPSSRKGSKYLRLPQMFVALQLPLYYLEQLHQLANGNYSDAYKTNFKRKKYYIEILSKM